MTDDEYLDSLRPAAGALHREPSDDARDRIRSRVRARIAEPSVLDFVVRWRRSIATGLAGVAAVSAVAASLLVAELSDPVVFVRGAVLMSEDIYRVIW